MRRTFLSLGLCGGALLFACLEDGGTDSGGQMMYTTHGSVSDGHSSVGDILAAPGDGVFGVQSGSGLGQIRDGWTVEYQKLLVSVGTVTFTSASAGEVEIATDFVVDLLSLPIGGALLDHVDGREKPSAIAFTLPPATAGKSRPLSRYTLDQDVELMAAGGYSLYVEGTIEKADGMSCKPDVPSDCAPAPVVRFRWGLPQGVAYDDCVWTDYTVFTENVTLSFPAVAWLQTAIGSERPTLRAQWIADADLDRDGETTIAELRQIGASTLLSRRRGYDLSGAAGSVDTVYDFLREQARQIGMRARGECGSVTNL
ncbi:hypothetical protein OV203_05925 [Nannocystis sp. ILAH1]|uniref:hypothetical protein n=1 Tax=unclassified Nannocystis TaxID=2627009 RepID=UPI00226DD644|nr:MULTISPECIES: hypothetical protein [unclassified Nannocystis]MCY0986648.1 hypothetical protein [Nannocystis sp. ILAH1]MCY1071528.1 hypothetical protein [Nannocystis sp. RBIL2]